MTRLQPCRATRRSIRLVLLTVFLSFCCPWPGQAAEAVLGFGHALSTGAFRPLAPQSMDDGFSFESSFFSGRGSGVDPQAQRRVSGLGVLGESSDRLAELEGDQRITALLIDGKYDFAFDFGTGLALRPYVGGSMGLAFLESTGTAGLGQDRAMTPLFRIGGGVVYKLGADWDLSLNYKAGYTSGSVFTGRSQERVDLQSLDMGLKFKF